jgi:hypothetical protein
VAAEGQALSANCFKKQILKEETENKSKVWKGYGKPLTT